MALLENEYPVLNHHGLKVGDPFNHLIRGDNERYIADVATTSDGKGNFIAIYFKFQNSQTPMFKVFNIDTGEVHGIFSEGGHVSFLGENLKVSQIKQHSFNVLLYGLFDINGNELIPIKYNFLNITDEGNLVGFIKEGGESNDEGRYVFDSDFKPKKILERDGEYEISIRAARQDKKEYYIAESVDYDTTYYDVNKSADDSTVVRIEKKAFEKSMKITPNGFPDNPQLLGEINGFFLIVANDDYDHLSIVDKNGNFATIEAIKGPLIRYRFDGKKLICITNEVGGGKIKTIDLSTIYNKMTVLSGSVVEFEGIKYLISDKVSFKKKIDAGKLLTAAGKNLIGISDFLLRIKEETVNTLTVGSKKLYKKLLGMN